MHNVMFLGWNNPVVGREALASELFASWISYWGTQQQAGNIESFDPILLSQHGGDMNGFFLVKGETMKLAEMRNSEQFIKLAMQTGYALDGFGIIDGWHGENLMHLMAQWSEMAR